MAASSPILRRKKGSGSLRDMGDGRWQLTINVGGKRFSDSFEARNPTEAEARSHAVHAELTERARLEAGRDPERDARLRMSFAEYSAYYLTRSTRLAATTRERYRQVIEQHIAGSPLGRQRITEITPHDVKRWQEALKPGTGRRTKKVKPLSRASVVKAHNVVSAVFTFAMIQEDVSSNPVRSPIARVEDMGDDEASAERGSVAMTLAEVAAFVELARSEESVAVFAAILLSARLGLRRGEALGLQWRDFDFGARKVTVRRAVAQAGNAEPQVKATQTKKQREIPITDDLIAELRLLSAEQGKRIGACFVASVDGTKPQQPKDYTSRFRALVKRHSLTLTPHLLRHAWCSQMVALGYDAVTIANMSGHSPDVLLTTYAHAFDTRKAEAMAAYDEAYRAAARG